MNALANNIVDIPAELARKRLIDIEQVATLIGRSHWEVRRLYKAGAFPQPLKINNRRLNWRLGDILDYIDSKAALSGAT
jgi:predicted DNA-binding transcriptional regulator AlpA